MKLINAKILSAKELHQFLILQFTIERNELTRQLIIEQIIKLTDEIRGND